MSSTKRSTKELVGLRKKIDGIDRAIISQIAKRKKLEVAIGAYKRKTGMKFLDTERRRKVLKTRIAQGKAEGVQPELTLKLFTVIHHYSLSTQKKGKQI